MRLVVLIVNNPDNLTAVLKKWLEIGVRGATVLESTGMGRELADVVPIFGGLRRLLSDDRSYSQTVLSVMKDELVPAAKEAALQICGDLRRPNSGLFFTVPVDDVTGLAPVGGVKGE